MSGKIGIRREDKNRWERRVPLTPEHIETLKQNHDIDTIIQPSEIRVFSDDEYQKIGSEINEDLNDANVIFAVKEIPKSNFIAKKTYVFFSHTVKGQKKNMPMLKKMMELKCNLIDYEKITDEKNRRLIFFGRFAGLAGMIDTLWAFGQRMKVNGLDTLFSQIKKTVEYDSLDNAKKHIMEIGEKIRKEGLPEILAPITIAVAGYGNVSKGAQEIIDLLPFREIRPSQLDALEENYDNKTIYKVVFKEEDMVEPVHNEEVFDLEEYYAKPHLYRSIFQKYIRKFTILMNCIYWDKRYPRLITKYFMEENFTGQMKLQVIGDISVDINGAIEFTEKNTTPENPVFVYNPVRRDIIDGYTGSGVVVMAVDNLPCELPKESSKAFGDILINYVPSITKADYNVDFNSLNLTDEIKKAVVLYHGRLTPNFEYINKFL